MLNELISRCAMLVLTWAVATVSAGQTVRLVTGSPVRGKVVGISEEGLQVRTATGDRTFTWDTLAASTRFRYQAVYRANYSAVLRGVPRSQWANPPDPLVVEELKTLVLSEDEAAGPVIPAPAGARSADSPSPSLVIWDELHYQDVPPLASTSFPSAVFRDFERTSFVGFQYGTSSTDVIYFAFDPDGSEVGSGTMFVYSPGAAEFKETACIKGFKKGAGADRHVTYREVRVGSSLGRVTAAMEFDVETRGLRTNEAYFTVEVELSRDKSQSSHTLYLKCEDLLFGNGWIPVKGLIDLPNLGLHCAVSGETAQVNLLLFMANMIMIPRGGMDTRAALRVEDEKGNVVYRDNVKMDLFPPPAGGVISSLRRVLPGNTYTVIAEMDLGPFLGKVEAREHLTMPAGQ